MTAQERKKIENAFYDYPNNTDERLNKLVESVLTKYRFERNEQLIRMYYFERKQIYNIRKTFKITTRNFYYCLSNIMDMSYLFAKDLKII